MIKLRKATERGHANHGWLDTYHTFSFADFYDPEHMGYSALRVINEDTIDGAMGFPTHAHKDMEIITFVTEGALEHKDSMGTSSVINPGEIQYMSAGTGVTHSEFNHFKDKKTHLFQIWIMPDKKNYEPRYDQKSFAPQFACSDFVLVASHIGKQNSIAVRQDVDIYMGSAKGGAEISHKTLPHRKAWLQMIKGQLSLNGTKLEASDGAAIEMVESIEIKAEPGAEFIFFDLP